MRPLFAIAPLAFVLALFSPSPAEWTASFESFKAAFSSGSKTTSGPASITHVHTSVDH